MLCSFLSLIGLAVVCADNELHAYDDRPHVHVHESRKDLQLSLTQSYGPLVWGDFNVIHTTDTHGWLLGHQKHSWPEPNYSGDLGDFASFVWHMNQTAIKNKVDLLLVDSGDLHDGTGLSDGYPAGGINGHDSDEFFKRLPYDVMSIGNHELQNYTVTNDTYFNFVPHLKGRYLSSNANITLFYSNGTSESVPVGNRYTKFTTARGHNVTSLGVLFNARDNSTDTTVQTVEKMVEEKWFKDAITEEPSVFLLVGPAVVKAIRAVHNCTPIMIFGGHSHIRDCQQHDGRSMALQSGRYMETVGWMSANITAAKGNCNNITFSRRYLDPNRVTYKYHTNITSDSIFNTTEGLKITHDLKQLADKFDLNHIYGNAPQDYTVDRDQYNSSGSALRLFIVEAAPLALAINNKRAGTPNITIINAALMRFDVYNGSFTKNDQISAVMYPDQFRFISNVTTSLVAKLLDLMNTRRDKCSKQRELWDFEPIESRHQMHHSWLEDAEKHQQTTLMIDPRTPGYVTDDKCPGVGDDTPHIKPNYYRAPHYISSKPPNVTSNTIDLVYNVYIQNEVVCNLNLVQTVKKYTLNDTSLYTNTTTNEVLGLYAQAKWN